MTSRETMRFAQQLSTLTCMDIGEAIMIANACVAARHSKEFQTMFGTRGVTALRKGMSHISKGGPLPKRTFSDLIKPPTTT